MASLARHVSAIIAAGGRGLRFGGGQPKQLATLGGRTILQRSVDAFIDSDVVAEVVVALPASLAADPPVYLRSRAKPVLIVDGGERRQDSVRHAFERIDRRSEVVVIHDAARPLVTDALIRRTIDAAFATGAAIAALRASDTVKRADAAGRIAETLPRDRIYLAQTPQAFRVDVLRHALTIRADATDEAALAEQAGHPVQLVEGDPRNVKITTPEDLELAERLLDTPEGVPYPPAGLRIGNGYDLHRLVEGRPLVLGGVTIPFDKGLLGHSDGDVICHAITDAILGAAGAGDIGRHFPDTDAAWKDADSVDLLRRAAAIVAAAGYTVVNVDVVVVAQRPKLSPHADAIRARVAAAIGCDPLQVSVKGKTNEGVDSVGAGEAIAAHAVALLARHR
ncbi:MAG TPA: 2-C-methyl-D-erythritol 4-phosphate cytidylyltransferase [Vicinamibacterales bacterium]|nr:2-C-methyl-D-erythritol 4-phosphate cytidylyltransferase [Vicinamibacterales bacterium]